MWRYFCLYGLLYILLTLLVKQYFLNELFFYQVFKDQLPYHKISEYLGKNRLELDTYIFVPFSMFLKWLAISSSLWIVFHLKNQDLPFHQILNVVALSEWVWVLAMCTKMVYWLQVGTIELSHAQFANWFSLYHIAFWDVEGWIPKWIFNQIHLYHVVYVGALAIVFKNWNNRSFYKIVSQISLGYGILVCLYLLLMTFVQLQMNIHGLSV
jgi:hypothetical protein